ncbi:MAG TPA: SpoVR family protein [Phycisphaerae bacterium]|nr:SpoVR family protein [Phycisphaerae bacterium]HRW51306.1 SpoVR family protein [Phycisphaerae bacterium]
MSIETKRPDLARYAREIMEIAANAGLDFFETRFEMVDFDTMQQIAAYGGFPQRYPHWRFGMEYEKLRKQHVYGLGKIYELVINNDPCYAYLVADNELTDQKLVMAHVYAHCDFFKNNYWFSKTNRKMMDEMANHATRVRKHIDRYGHDNVESFIDLCSTLDNLIDPHSPFMRRQKQPGGGGEERMSDERHANRDTGGFQAKPYMESWINPPEVMRRQREAALKERQASRGRLPEQPLRDVLRFLLDHAPLEDWEADVLSIIREEAYYFAPQGQTKIMNEGWATFWHSRLMTTKILRDEDIITYADHHSGTVAMSPGRLNPYKIGVELFRDIEDRWNRGRFGKEYEECSTMAEMRKWNKDVGLGREKIFEVRRIHNDVTFIDEFLTPEFVDRFRMYHYRYDPATRRMVVVNRDFKKIKQQLLFMLTNHMQPYIYVVDGNYANRGELYLAHKHTGVDLDIKYAVETLRNVQRVWRRPAHLQAMINEEMVLFSFDGEQSQQQKIHEDLPKPAHSL